MSNAVNGALNIIGVNIYVLANPIGRKNVSLPI
ncbi:MAG: hypothetical protein ACJA1P_000757 [Maribacter sp.]|jgi:hypothetical protein